MKAVLEEVRKKNLKIGKSKWTSVKFGQVAFQKKESIDRDNTDVKFYVKGEHMESEDLHIRQWGELADEYLGPAFIRRFESGDILYGSRRTYLKKVAVAHFDGITSNTTFVINANESLIIKELLPFVMLSEGFTQHSIKNSKGSVNPYINWKDIANYEFLLPPKDQQARLAELLWSADEVIQYDLSLIQKALNLRSTLLHEIYSRKPRLLHSTKTKLSLIIKLSSGCTRPKELKETPSGSFVYPVYGGNGVIGYSDQFMLEHSTIVLGRVGEYCGVVHDSPPKSWISDNALYVKEFLIPVDQKYLSRFLEYIDLNKQQNKSSHPLITQERVLENEIELLDEKLVGESLVEIETIETTIQNTRLKAKSSKQLQKSLINQIF